MLITSTGPFSLEVGEQVNFSFAVIFGEDKYDLISNAQVAQLMYNNKYQYHSFDFNNDNIINVIDIVYLINIILGTESELSSADVNQDGFIDILDVIQLADIILSN